MGRELMTQVTREDLAGLQERYDWKPGERKQAIADMAERARQISKEMALAVGRTTGTRPRARTG